MSDWSFRPLAIIAFMSFLFSTMWSGSVQRPLPISGAFFGAYLTLTSQWSVGTGDGDISQSKVSPFSLSAIYILSIRDFIWSPLACAQYVYSLLDGWFCLHASFILQEKRRFLSASIALGSCNLAGALSMGSSVTFRSPRMKSGLGILRLSPSLLSSGQKVWCLARSLGAYTLISVVDSVSNQSNLMTRALPTQSSYVLIFLGVYDKGYSSRGSRHQ